MPPRQPQSATPRRRPWVAVALAASGVALAALVAADHRAEERRFESLNDRLAGLEIPEEAAGPLRQALRENDPTHRELAVARAFVGADAPEIGDPEDEAATIRRLEVARELAAGGVVARPAAWEAPLLLGAATYLARRRAEDPRLVTEAPDWDLPLARARELAPTAGEPARFSAIAYLDLWPMLSPEKRQVARSLLSRALLGGRTRNRLLDAWIEIVDDPAEAMTVLPDVAEVWTAAERLFARRGDWTSAIEARRRWRQALAGEWATRLEAASERRTAAPEAARREALGVIAAVPPEALFLPLIERALAEAPAGPPEPSLVAGATAWLEWALDLELVGVEALPPPLVDRLAGLAGELPPTQAARAALAAGRIDVARRIEREAGPAAADEPWGGYWIANAAELAARGEHRAAAVSLDRVLGGWRASPVYDVVAERAATAAGDEAAAVAARRRLSMRAPEVDLRHPVRQGDRSARFALFTSRPATGITVEIGEGQPGTLLGVQLDGRLIDLFRARSGRYLEIEAPIAPGLHLVEVTAATGGGAQIRRLAPVP